MSQKKEVEEPAIVKAETNLQMIAFDEQSGRVITWGLVSDAASVTEALKILGYGKVTMQA